VVSLPGGGAVVLGLFLVIDIGLFPRSLCGLFCRCRLRGAVIPEMMPLLASLVPSPAPVAPVIPSLAGLLLRSRGLPGLRGRCRLAAGCLLWLI
jgi:hypothetical protein